MPLIASGVNSYPVAWLNLRTSGNAPSNNVSQHNSAPRFSDAHKGWVFLVRNEGGASRAGRRFRTAPTGERRLPSSRSSRIGLGLAIGAGEERTRVVKRSMFVRYGLISLYEIMSRCVFCSSVVKCWEGLRLFDIVEAEMKGR